MYLNKKSTVDSIGCWFDSNEDAENDFDFHEVKLPNWTIQSAFIEIDCNDFNKTDNNDLIRVVFLCLIRSVSDNDDDDDDKWEECTWPSSTTLNRD